MSFHFFFAGNFFFQSKFYIQNRSHTHCLYSSMHPCFIKFFDLLIFTILFSFFFWFSLSFSLLNMLSIINNGNIKNQPMKRKKNYWLNDWTNKLEQTTKKNLILIDRRFNRIRSQPKWKQSKAKQMEEKSNYKSILSSS